MGEIILVVIGILIALQINNWNEWRKDRILENEYYCRLLEDLNQDKDQLKEFVNASKERLKSANEAARLLQQDNTLKLDIGRQIDLTVQYINADFISNKSAFEDLKSGANLNVIQDKKVVNSLNHYHNKVASHTKVIRINSDFVLSRFSSYQNLMEVGWVHAKMDSDRFKKGMETDVYEEVPVNNQELLSDELQLQLYNDVLWYISANSRHVELYGFIKDEILKLNGILQSKCPNPND